MGAVARNGKAQGSIDIFSSRGDPRFGALAATAGLLLCRYAGKGGGIGGDVCLGPGTSRINGIKMDVVDIHVAFSI